MTSPDRLATIIASNYCLLSLLQQALMAKCANGLYQEPEKQFDAAF
ncbi:MULTISPECIES: hypothetical protein [Paenalcaligenes]|nr:hypothetical protein [Paenalcaligenes sp.]